MLRSSSIAKVSAYLATRPPGETVRLRAIARATCSARKTVAEVVTALESAGCLDRPRQPTGRPASPVGPCCDCGTMGGALILGTDRPIRVRLTRWGIPEKKACKKCYYKRSYQDEGSH